MIWITFDQLQRAFIRDPSSVERLAWFLDLDCIGKECILAVDDELKRMQILELELKLENNEQY